MQYDYYKIFSYSQSALSAIENKDINEIIKLLIDEERKGRQIHFEWVPSHSGVVGNEIADMEARIASLEEGSLSVPTNKREVKGTLDKYINKEKDKEWNSTRRSQTAMQLFPNRKDFSLTHRCYVDSCDVLFLLSNPFM